MDILIISEERNILHIFNKGYTVDYTFYDSKGHSIDGGVLESSKEKFNNDVVIQEIISMFQDAIKFSKPYLYLEGEKADRLLDLIEMEDSKNNQKIINEYINSADQKYNYDLNIDK